MEYDSQLLKEEIIMKSISVKEQRSIEGGASKYVYCPICNYKYKTGWIERLFRSNRTVRGYLQSKHGILRNIGNMTQSVHR